MATAVLHPKLAPTPACGSLGDPAAGTQRHGCSGTPGGGGAPARRRPARAAAVPRRHQVRAASSGRGDRRVPAAAARPPKRVRHRWRPGPPAAVAQWSWVRPRDPRTVVERMGGAQTVDGWAGGEVGRGRRSTFRPLVVVGRRPTVRGHGSDWPPRQDSAARRAAAAAAWHVDTRAARPARQASPLATQPGQSDSGMTVRWRGRRHPAQPLSGGPTPPPTGAEDVPWSTTWSTCSTATGGWRGAPPPP